MAKPGGTRYTNAVAMGDTGRALPVLDSVALPEERFRSLVACADDSIVVTDLDATILFVNEAGRRLAGVADGDDLAGIKAFELIAQESRAATAEGLRCVLTDGVARNREVVVARRDGGRVPIEMTVSVLRDAAGIPVGYISIVRDVAARKREQESTAALLDIARGINGRLELSEILDRVQKRTAEALRCDAVATFCWDPRPAGFRLAGHYGPALDAPLQAMPILFQRQPAFVDRLTKVRTVILNDIEAQDWIPPELLRPLGVAALVWTQLVVHARPIGALVALQTMPGQPFDEVQVALLEGIAEQVALGMGAVELYQKSQRETEASAIRARELDGANRTKSDFVAAIAHELRSPLSVITGYSSLLVDGAFGELSTEQVDVIQRVDRTTATLAELVSTLLDFSRLESSQLRTEPQDVDLRLLLATVAEETHELRARKPEVGFRFEADADLPPLHTDPLKLKVVLKNLIGNALKFTDQGEVTLIAVAVEHGIELRVSDTGDGIPKEAQEIIFDAFRQAPSTRRGQGGFGLGLYIVRRLLELLHGTIRVTSEKGRGTTFVISLPLRPASS